MNKANQLPVSLLKEGWNVLKVYPGYQVGATWSRPVSVNFLITSRCNSKCVTCDSWKLTDHEQELTLDDFRRLAQEMADLGVPIATIGGGEPLVRTDIYEILHAFKERGITVQLTTNALTLRSDQRKKLMETGVNRVTISYDSHIPELYEKIRGVDGLKSVYENLRSLLAEKSPSLEVDTNTVLCADNAETFLDTIDHLIEMGVPKVNFSAVTTAGVNYLMTESKQDLANIPLSLVHKITHGLLERKRTTKAISASTDFIRGLPDYYVKPSEVVYPCFAGYLTLDVFQNGNIHGCGNLPSIGNVRDGSLKEIWHGQQAELNRRNMAEGKCPNCYLSCKIELALAANPRHLPRFALDKLL